MVCTLDVAVDEVENAATALALVACWWEDNNEGFDLCVSDAKRDGSLHAALTW